jgi:cytidyltransferase-like protein
MLSDRKPVVVAIAGGFDPVHQGHLDHIKKAAALGDKLLVFVSNDEDIIRKRTKDGVPGKCNIPLDARCEMLFLICFGLGINYHVVPTLDKDGTQAETLRRFHPDIFAKGGDRTDDHKMPINELLVCRELGIDIRYGIGDLLNHSREMVID